MNTLTANVSRSESMRRVVLGIAILGFFFATPGIPAWATFIALYPLATALLQWDPLNAVFNKILSDTEDSANHAAISGMQKV